MNRYTWLIFLLLLLNTAPLAARPAEAWYQSVWCQGMGGETEVRLADGRRIDCQTPTHAIEIEFARKWPEAIGQALDYGMLTGQQGGIVLILQRTDDEAYWQRLNSVIRHYHLPITLWRLGP